MSNIAKFNVKLIDTPEVIENTAQTKAVDLNKGIEIDSEALFTCSDKQKAFRIDSDCDIIENTLKQATEVKIMKENMGKSFAHVDFIEDTELIETNKENIPNNQSVDVIPNTELDSSFVLTPSIQSNIPPSRSKVTKRSKKPPSKFSMNPLEKATTSKFSPLTVVQTKTPPQKQRRARAPKQETLTKYMSPKSSSVLTNPSSLPADTKPVVACTRMSKDHLVAILVLARKNLIEFSEVHSPNVTHLVVDVDEDNCVKECTIKYLLSVARGIWVVNFKWIEESLKSNCVADEDRFEASDSFGTIGPKLSRLRTDYLLRSFKICILPPITTGTTNELQVCCFDGYVRYD